MLLAGLLMACNRRSPLSTEPFTLPSPTSPPPGTLFGVVFEPRALIGTASGTATVILNRPTVEQDLDITISSSDSSVVLQSSVATVPAGRDRASVRVTSQNPQADKQVGITASAVSASITASLPVWVAVPTFFVWFSDPGDPIGRGEFGRLFAPVQTFRITGDASLVHVDITGSERWSLEFSAIRGSRLQVGVYEQAMRSSSRDASHPGLEVGGRGTGCNTVGGRFEVHDIAPGSGVPNRFDITFEHRCENFFPPLRGEVRFNGGTR